MNTAQKSITLIGAPTNLGAHNLGVEMGPNAYRYQEIARKLQDAGFVVTDMGNVSVPERWDVQPGDNPALPYVDEIVRISEDIAKRAQQALGDGARPVVLGGDHTVCLGAVSGASRSVNGTLGLIYFDAHGDMHTDETSLTHNLHGMQLASLMGFGAEQLRTIGNSDVKVQPAHVLHIGGSDWDQAELDLVAREGIALYTMDNCLTHAFGPLLKMIDELQAKVDHIWVSLDLDSIDALYAPAAGMPNSRGLFYREIKMLATYIGKHCKVAGMDVVEYNPLLDTDRKTAELATELIANVMGGEYSWYTDYLSHNRDA